MPTVTTVSATMIGDELAHGLTRMRFQLSGGADPTPSDIDAALVAMQGFWEGIKDRVVAGIAITYQALAIVEDVALGTTIGDVSATAVPTATSGTDTSPEHVSGTGGRVTWHTGVRRRSREIRGATFIVPMGSGQFGAAGNLTTACTTACLAAANAYLTAMATSGLQPVIYGRPLPARGTHPAIAGETGAIASAAMSQIPSFLKRRRA